MSVIFRSLQKLKAQAGADYRPALPFKKQHHIFGLSQGRFAHLRIVSLVLLIFLGGIGTSYGIYKLRGDAATIPQPDPAAGGAGTALAPQR